MFCGYEAVFGAFAKYSNEGSDRDSECNPPQNPLTQHGLKSLHDDVALPAALQTHGARASVGTSSFPAETTEGLSIVLDQFKAAAIKSPPPPNCAQSVSSLTAA